MLNFYLYSVTSISLLLFYTASISFVKGLIYFSASAGAGEHGLGVITPGPGSAAVALPLRWLHWGWLRRQFDLDSSGKRFGHMFYLFSIVCLNIMVVLFAGGVGIASLLAFLLGAAELNPDTASRSGVLVSALLLSLLLWRHHWRQLTEHFGEDFHFLKSGTERSKEAPA